MAVTKQFLSGGSANGRPIKVAATATPGTLIHTADATAKDELWLFATNQTAGDIVLTVEFGGTTSTDDLLKFTVPANETIPIVPGLVLSGGLITRAFAVGSANNINISGYVNRIT